MQGQRPLSGGKPRSPLTIAAWALALLAAAGLAYWGYSAYQKRALQEAALALVVDATARLRDALQPRQDGPAAAEQLNAHFKALAAASQRLSALETWRDPQLGEAAQGYVDEAHALLRRQIAVLAASARLTEDLDALSAHIGSARVRSGDWIREAVGLRQQMDRDYFDYRLAEGGLQKSLQSVPNARPPLLPFVAARDLIEDAPLEDARTRLTDASAQLARRVEAARKLPLPR